MNIAVIGLGNIGSRVAKNLTAGGQKIIVADKTLAKAEKVAVELGGNAQAMPVADAIARPTSSSSRVYFDAIKQLVAAHHAARLAGKIIVDPSNPIAPDGKGGFKKTIPAEQSSGQLISALLPAGARLVKAFGTLGAESPGGRRQPPAGTRGAVLCDGQCGGRGSCGPAHCRERILTGQRGRHRQIDPHRGGRRSPRVRQAGQARQRQRGTATDLTKSPRIDFAER